MPAFESGKDRPQAAVWWRAIGVDGYGELSISSPYQLKVRWVDTKNKVLAPNANTIAYDAQIVLDRSVPVDSLFWLGPVASLNVRVPVLGNIYQLKKLAVTPDIKGRNVRYDGGLMRYRDQPTGFLTQGCFTDVDGYLMLDDDGQPSVQSPDPLSNAPAVDVDVQPVVDVDNAELLAQ